MSVYSVPSHYSKYFTYIHAILTIAWSKHCYFPCIEMRRRGFSQRRECSALKQGAQVWATTHSFCGASIIIHDDWKMNLEGPQGPGLAGFCIWPWSGPFTSGPRFSHPDVKRLGQDFWYRNTIPKNCMNIFCTVLISVPVSSPMENCSFMVW